MPQPYKLGPAFSPPKKVAGLPPERSMRVTVRPTPVPTPPASAIEAPSKSPSLRKRKGFLLSALGNLMPGQSTIENYSLLEKVVTGAEEAVDVLEVASFFDQNAHLLNTPAFAKAKAALTSQAQKAASIVSPANAARLAKGGKAVAVGGRAMARRLPQINAALAGVDLARTASSPTYREEALKSIDGWDSSADVFSLDAALQAYDRPAATVNAMARAAGEAMPSNIAAKKSKSEADYWLEKNRLNTRLREREASFRRKP